ncbi:electron transport complex subunit RsxC [Actinobacillus equuli subsp. equuli]|uniref:Ion-translocating oxidoreductase complex subunit C n=1 Tax=Actinobacillus equuli subsp. equuli TaxID=202947 RepID=A0A9X4JCH8_ACTEU|nr:electron transport complex subunit RsxC [Actinobacillus equuli]MDE8033853.1 electron transport complex subunit RsxC [Actinobacillus equuli subsp. equuli]MDG4948100.1 electron transport complex subunit RsxC [Actinobacillus equuli subsp. haemolyticus]
MPNPNLVLERIRQTKQTGKLWAYPGGIHPMENKKQSNQKPIRSLHLPKFFYVPVVQHSGWAGELIVNVGDKVLKGQALTKGDNFRQLPVHSPTSGTVLGIAPHVSAHPSGLPEVTVIIETDGKDEWIERQPIDDFLTLTSDQIIQKVYQYGIAGLGGAVFPTASKLSLADKRCKLLIINGAECEPYITCDDRLMQDYTAELIEGIRILRYVLRPEEVVLAIEDNKPKAIKAIQKALKGSDDIHVQPIPTKYPSGASDQLVQVLTGLEIPQGKRTIEMGIVMHNVGTAFAVKRAVMDDEPLIERVVTLTGDKIRNKGNVWARLGTPIQHLLEQVDYQADSRFPVFLGGPMTGFILQSLQAPVTKTANCIIAPDHFEYAPPEPERSCIRCSSCSDACPVGLLPQQLYWFARSDDHDKSKEYHLEACIECGVCAYVCPSYIPLIQYFRQEKAKIAEIEEKAKKAEEAKIRFEAREARLQKEKEARTARIAQAADKRREEIASSAGEDPVAAALARIKAKKAEAQTAEPVHAKADIKANGEPDNSELMAQRRARRLAKQAEVTNEVNDNLSINAVQQVEETDPKKAAVAAALARARAKKVAQQAPAQAVEMSEKIATATEAEDPRKAAVAAALARAKAKKAAQQAPEQAVENAEKVAAAIEVEDLRKAAVAAALARAKAKKAAQQAPEQAVENAEKVATAMEAEDPRKAAVAAALARAKAKKAAQQAAQQVSEQAVENAEKIATAMEAEDPRKAAVAAALARAKAKKAAQQVAQQVSEQAVENAEKVATATEVEDPRKAAVAAAIARAKAKKMSQGLQND